MQISTSFFSLNNNLLSVCDNCSALGIVKFKALKIHAFGPRCGLIYEQKMRKKQHGRVCVQLIVLFSIYTISCSHICTQSYAGSTAISRVSTTLKHGDSLRILRCFVAITSSLDNSHKTSVDLRYGGALHLHRVPNIRGTRQPRVSSANAFGTAGSLNVFAFRLRTY